MARSLNARAFTVGNNIVFDSGHYNAGSTTGKRLLAHELVHTIQQGATPKRWRAETHTDASVDSGLRIGGGVGDIIQREVGRAEVSSASDVQRRIRARIREVDSSPRSWAARIYGAGLAALFAGSGAILGTAALGGVGAITGGVGLGLVGGGLGALGGAALGTFPPWLNLSRLVALSLTFNPGAARDAPGNAFVYTCSGGWIDLGHFFISALVGYMRGYNFAMTSGWRMEDTWQQAFYQLARLIDPEELRTENIPIVGGLIEGNARSFFTIEDLPSDHLGSQLGGLMRGDPFELFDINRFMSAFFSALGAVLPEGETLDRMLEETSPGGIPRQHRSITPYLLQSAFDAGLCTRGA